LAHFAGRKAGRNEPDFLLCRCMIRENKKWINALIDEKNRVGIDVDIENRAHI
jgi:hypothetical protein